MVIGGYTLNLYCDCQNCEVIKLPVEYRTEETGFKSIAGNNLTECVRAAKKRGWKFNANKTHCLAPGHMRKSAEGN